MSRSVAIFGGTYNPIHLGHLRAAEEVRDVQRLDEVRFVPAAIPPHKDPTAVTLASVKHRLRMVELAVADTPGFGAWDIELARPGPSYSIDTIRALRAELVPGDRVGFMLGRDAFAEFHTWKEFTEIFALCDVIVVTRPPLTCALGEADLPVAARKAFRYDPDVGGFLHESGHRLIMQQVTSLDVSATEIRRLVGAGRSIRFLLPDVVAAYVQEHHIFGAGPTSS